LTGNHESLKKLKIMGKTSNEDIQKIGRATPEFTLVERKEPTPL
jgi:hypothetical protein